MDEAALAEILGPDSYDIIHTGEPARDQEVLQRVCRAGPSENQRLVATSKTRAYRHPSSWRRRLAVSGSNRKSWFRVGTLIRRPGGKKFSIAELEVMNSTAIEICRGYVEAQHDYALIKRGSSGVNQYAQRIISTPGTQDGLAWKNTDGTWDGPIGEKVAAAIERGYTSRTEPYHGYFFKVLKGQGPAAPLGQLDFVVKGVMIGGFALIAFPAQYRLTGVKTFIVSHDGVVYQKDLGPKTLEVAAAIDRSTRIRLGLQSWMRINQGTIECRRISTKKRFVDRPDL